MSEVVDPRYGVYAITLRTCMLGYALPRVRGRPYHYHRKVRSTRCRLSRQSL